MYCSFLSLTVDMGIIIIHYVSTPVLFSDSLRGIMDEYQCQNGI